MPPAKKPLGYSKANALNCTTAICWMALFYAFKYLEPSFVTGLMFAIGPLFTLTLLREKNKKFYLMEAGVAVGILLSILFIIGVSLKGQSGLENISTVNNIVQPVTLSVLMPI